MSLKTKSFFANFLYSSKILNLFSRVFCDPKILLYPRIVEPDQIPYPLDCQSFVFPNTFRSHLEYYKKTCNVISPVELVEGVLAKKNFPPRTLALTFDGGWEDTWRVAFPMLVEFGFPAMVFPIAGFLGKKKLLWSNKLALIIQYWSSQDAKVEESIMSLFATHMASRSSFEISRMLPRFVESFKRMDRTQRKTSIDALWEETGICEEEIPSQFMSWENAKQMHSKGIEFGNYTFECDYCSEMDDEDLFEDAKKVSRVFQENGIPLGVLFSPPDGMWDDKTVNFARREGFCAILGMGGKNYFDEKPVIFNRVKIGEGRSRTKALNAVHIWLRKSR